MANWIDFSSITGSGNTNITVTGSPLYDTTPRVASYNVFTPYGEQKNVHILQTDTLSGSGFTVFYNVTRTGNTQILSSSIDLTSNEYANMTMSVDGGEYISLAKTYSFRTKGLHQVNFLSTYVGNNMFNVGVSGTAINAQYVILNTVTEIRMQAFWGCAELLCVYITSNLTTIGYGAFGNCGKLEYINLPNTLTSMSGGSAFVDCVSLTSITIPNSCTDIGSACFWGCDNLKTIVLPSGLTEIKRLAFSDCPSLTGITIPNSVTSIGEAAFWADISLTTITIPNSVTTLGVSAFENCTGLTQAVLPSGLTIIPNNLFAVCDSLGNVEIPSGVTTIGTKAFEQNRARTSLSIPSSVTSLDRYAFMNCTSLTTIHSYMPIAGDCPYFGRELQNNGILIYPRNTDYSAWLSTEPYCLGYFNWRGVED